MTLTEPLVVDLVRQQTPPGCCRMCKCCLYAANAYVSQLSFIVGYLVTVTYGKSRMEGVIGLASRRFGASKLMRRVVE